MAKTSLAEQLKKLQTPQTQLLLQTREKSSFLFDSKEAASFDKDTFYDLGISGLEELKALNPNFNGFDNTLFDVTSRYFERAVETTETNEKLNDQIKTFLTLLSPYFLLKPAHKALEWLINRYHIEKFNVDDILFLILPYHETNHFAQMLKILSIKKDSGRWHWLFQVKTARVPLSKTALLNRAASDMSFLKFVCDMPAQAIKIHGSRVSCLSTLFAFYCTTVIGGLQHAEPISEVHISHILPSVLTALSSSLLDYTASSFMIIARLATKTCLTPKILTVLLNKISRVEHSKLRTETSLVLVLLCQNNEGKCEFPEKAAELLLETPWLVPSLVTLQKGVVQITPFVTLLLPTCLKLIQKGQEKYKPFVERLLTDIRFDEEKVDDIFMVLLSEFDEKSDHDTVKWYSQLLKGLEHSFPKVFDAVVSSALSNEKSKEGISVKTILGINTSRNDLFLKLVHPNEDVRVQAIKHIGKHFEPDQIAWLNQTLLDRLRDDSSKVVRQVLRLPESHLSSLPSDILIRNLISVIARFSTSDEPIVMQALTVLFQNYKEEHKTLFVIALLPHIMSVMHKTKIVEESSEKNIPFLLALKSYSETESKAETALWLTLSNGDNIPPIEDILETLSQWKSLKSHSLFWFSSSLLIASKMSDQLSLETGDIVMEFLIEYLKFPKVVSSSNIYFLTPEILEASMDECKTGKLPILGALHCLNILSQCIKSFSHRKPWVDLHTKSNVFSMSMFKVLHEGCESKDKPIRVAFLHAMKAFFQFKQLSVIKWLILGMHREYLLGLSNLLENLSHFPESEQQILFLMNALILESSLGNKCLDLVIKKINDDSNLLSTSLKENSLVIPSLLILLSSRVEGIRSKAMKIASLFTESLSTGFYRPLVEALVDHSTEILLDHEQMEIFAYTFLSPSEEVKSLLKRDVAKSAEKILHHLITLIVNASTPSYIKAPLLEILQLVSSKEILLEFLPVASKHIGIQEKLDANESKILIHILKRLNKSVTDVFTEEKFWNTFKIALSDHKTIVEHPDYDKGICPSALILNQISKEVFHNLPEPQEKLQEKLLTIILEKVTEMDNVQVMTTNASLFKRITLDASMIVRLLSPMESVIVPYSPTSSLRARKRDSYNSLPSLHTLETVEWKRGVCLLELIQNKKQITNVALLLPMFFSLLKKCLLFEEQAPVEYTKQLLLSSILHCCAKLKDCTDKSSLGLEDLHVDVIIQCVRGSHNPQTHHHTLLALSYIAHLLPEQVLVNIMEIFTFIGSTFLRQDDAYSFQLISKIIETVIPILVKSQKGVVLEGAVTNVLRVFVSALLDVPEHRRIPIFKKLLVTLNNGEHMWIFLCLNFEKHVLEYNIIPALQENIEKEAPGSMSKILKYALRICGEFPPSVLLNTSFKLLEYISKLPHDKDNEAIAKIKDESLKLIFDIEKNSVKNFRHYKHTLLNFLSSLMSSKQFVQEIGELSVEETHSLKDVFSSIVEQCLVYIKSVSVQVEESEKNQISSKYWRAILTLCYDILDKTNALLPTDGFIEVISRLLHHPLDAVRRKAMELLGWRLQQPMPIPETKLRNLLEPLVATLDYLQPQDSDDRNPESQITLQAALFALKLMARHLSEKYMDDFKSVLEKVADILDSKNKLDGPVLGSLVLCLGELVYMLKAHSIALLPKYMPALISILHKNSSDGYIPDPSRGLSGFTSLDINIFPARLLRGSDLLLILSTVTAVHKVVETLAHFLSPYLEKLLYEVSILSSKFDSIEVGSIEPQQKGQSLPFKLKSIRKKISQVTSSRVLVEGVSGAHERLMKTGREEGVGPLMSILSDSFASPSDLTGDTVQLFLTALDFRTTRRAGSSEAEVLAVETPVIGAFTTLILKLSESSFRPLLKRVFHWANHSDHKQRIITFYRLTSNIAKSLKSLFPLFVGIFIENAAEMLKLNNPNKGDATYFNGDDSVENSVLLVECITETFLTAFTHDSSQKFLTNDYFNLIMEPFVDQLENRAGGDSKSNERCKKLITPCLAEMANATADDSLWKHLNHQILLKTRHNLPEVRIIGLRTTCALASKLGEGFMALLPETVPFLAELLEDDVEEVEHECQRIVNEMEEILGESIQKYF